MKKETRAKLRYLRTSPQKVRLIVDMIRGMKLDVAVSQLELSTKHAARPVLKLLNSAVANAKHNDSLKEDTLVIKTAFVDGGPTLNRWIPRAHGRATPIHKRTSHVTIILEGEVDEKAVEKAEKAEKTEKTEKATKLQSDEETKEATKEAAKEQSNEETVEKVVEDKKEVKPKTVKPKTSKKVVKKEKSVEKTTKKENPSADAQGKTEDKPKKK